MNGDEIVLHRAVMETEATEMLQPRKHDAVFVDCTIGYGGHSAAISRAFDASDRLIGIDRDAAAIAYCRQRFANVSFSCRLRQRGFDEAGDVLDEESVKTADGFLFDCGFSSPQVDDPQRGFSFMREGPLDMRMDQSQPLSAYEAVNSWSEDELTRIFKLYGEERFSRKIARAIARSREKANIETTQELADIVLQAIPPSYRHQEGIHPATRVFQALRIAVNDELGMLRRGLEAALSRLRPGGRIGVLSYHSLEHRIVKEIFRQYCGEVVQPLGPAQYAPKPPAKGVILTKKPMRPCAAEKEINPRSRSAQFRVLEKLS